jgi:hypothetical protein
LRIPLPSNQGHLADLGLSLVFLFLSACWQHNIGDSIAAAVIAIRIN